MTNKSMAIVSYITIIGWVISYLEYKKVQKKARWLITILASP